STQAWVKNTVSYGCTGSPAVARSASCTRSSAPGAVSQSLPGDRPGFAAVCFQRSVTHHRLKICSLSRRLEGWRSIHPQHSSCDLALVDITVRNFRQEKEGIPFLHRMDGGSGC